MSGPVVGEIPCCVVLLDGRELSIQLKPDEKLQVLFRRVCEMLTLSDDSFFGLKYTTQEGVQLWLSLRKSPFAQLAHLCNWALPIRLHFGTKFYPADPCKVSDENVRYQLYLQLRHDMLSGSLRVEAILLAELCALVLQSSLGDYNIDTCKADYVSQYQFIRGQNEALESRISEVHKVLRGIAPAAAEFIYLDKAKWLDTYGLCVYPTMTESIVVALGPFGCVAMKRDVNQRLSSTASPPNGTSNSNNSNVRLSQYLWSRVTECKRKESLLIVRTVDRENVEHTHQFVMRDRLVAKACCSHAREYLDLHRRAQPSASVSARPTVQRSTSATRRRHCVAGGSLMIEDGRADEKAADNENALQRADVHCTSKNADDQRGHFARNAGAHDLSLSLHSDGNLKDTLLPRNSSGPFDAVSDCNANAIALSANEQSASGLRNAKTQRNAKSDLADSDDDELQLLLPALHDRRAAELDFIERMRRKLERHAARNRVANSGRSSALSSSLCSAEPLPEPAVLSHILFEPVDPADNDDVRSIPYTLVESNTDADAAWLAQRRRIAQKYYRQRRHANGARFSNSHIAQRLLASRRGVMTESSGDESASRTSTHSEPSVLRHTDLALASFARQTNRLQQNGDVGTSRIHEEIRV